MNTLAQIVPQDTSDSFQSINTANSVAHKDTTDIKSLLVLIVVYF